MCVRPLKIFVLFRCGDRRQNLMSILTSIVDPRALGVEYCAFLFVRSILPIAYITLMTSQGSDTVTSKMLVSVTGPRAVNESGGPVIPGKPIDAYPYSAGIDYRRQNLTPIDNTC